MIFFTGMHREGSAHHFRFVCLSMNGLWKRKKPIGKKTWVLIDSGAFTILDTHGCWPESYSPQSYAVRLWEIHTRGIVNILGAVTQDYMCEERITKKTGLTVLEHQRLTVERYTMLIAELNKLFAGRIPFAVLPVLQGRTREDYLNHLEMYGNLITPQMWVGVGSICKRQGNPDVVEDILKAIKAARPDLFLHGFGVKLTALARKSIQKLLATADSMAWSFSARMQGRGKEANCWREAKRWRRRIHLHLKSQELT